MAELTINQKELLVLVADIVASHVSNNTVPVDNVSKLIEEVFYTLANIQNNGEGRGGVPKSAV
jgi:predicted transcriptional regulator